MPYRPEIDGLRAIAVLSVIVFHAYARALPGGFLGVDIFFVISGFLITGLIAEDLRHRRFSLAHFWERRVRRIAPALLATIAVTTPFAFWLMLPDDLENYGQSVVATLLFSNNILLWLTSGYFALEASFKPLMHTWSLGVEEQYYLLIPLLALALFRRAHRSDPVQSLKTVMLALTLASFAFSVWAAETLPIANFLLLPSRAWQLGIGALAALHRPALQRMAKSLNGPLSLLALAMVLVPMWVFTEVDPLPGLPTLIPVLGAAALLILAQADTAPGRWLALAPMRGIGLISYSAYLVHQPVLALARILSLDAPPPAHMLLLIVPILGLAALSWRYIEQPFRVPPRSGGMAQPLVYRRVAALTAPLLAMGAFLHFSSGIPGRFPELASDRAGFGANQNIAYNLRPRALAEKPLPDGESALSVMVIGNSYARDFINMAVDGAGLPESRFSYLEFEGCSTRTMPPWALRNLTIASHIVLGSGVNRSNHGCVEALIADIARQSRGEILLLGLKNFGWNNNALMQIPTPERYATRVRVLEPVQMDNAAALKLAAKGDFAPARYIDVLGLIADSQGRVPAFTPDHRLISQDRGHLTQAGAAYLGGLLFNGPAGSLVRHHQDSAE
jgi:peptidoglycan/LPS O-acetylase OafA/YrhL